MKRFFRFLFELVSKDPWRKLGSIVLAIALWFYVHKKITGQVPYKMEIRPMSSKSQESVTGVLYVKVPKDRVLASEWKNFEVILRGPNEDLAKLPHQLNAFCDLGEGNYETVPVNLSTLRWEPHQVANLIHEPKSINLHFEEIKKVSVTLKQESLDIEGEPPEYSQIQRDQIKFSPSGIMLTGPNSAIEKFNKGRSSPLFEKIRVDKNDPRTPQSFVLSLHKDLTKMGLSIEGESPKVDIPIVPKMESLNFKAKIRLIPEEGRNFKLQGAPDGQNWIEENAEVQFPAILKSEISDAWLQNNFDFYVALKDIPPGKAEQPQHTLEIFIRYPEQERFSKVRFVLKKTIDVVKK